MPGMITRPRHSNSINATVVGRLPRMVFSNYRELVRAAYAEKWFAVTPEAVQSVRRAREKSAANGGSTTERLDRSLAG